SNSDLILKLDFLGRKSPLRERFAQYLSDSCGAGQLQIQDKGEKSPDQLSQLFSTADFAIARVKPSLLGKSGAAITLLEHGLKLWVPMAENQSEISAHFEYRTDQCFAKLDELLASSLTFTAESRVKDVARKLLKDFDVAVDNS
ncbi:MAG TPA: hypothetical protein VJ911_04885, partial [Cryomorphaceae bacterium]|nr:hypothetical protein [Cryomorphaceae bacterium]